MKEKYYILLITIITAFIPLLLILSCISIQKKEKTIKSFSPEFRGAWIATVANIDWPSSPNLSTAKQQAELLKIIKDAKNIGLTDLIFQVRTSGDALYASTLEPWSPYLSGTMGKAPSPFYDPLKFLINNAHAYGIRVHAWVNLFRAKHSTYKGIYPKNHVLYRFPNAVYKLGGSGMLWMDPSNKAIENHTLSIIEDIITRYNIDGVHIDDYFYPYPSYLTTLPNKQFPDIVEWKQYKKRGGLLKRDAWRRSNINKIVKKIYMLIKKERPSILFGISPFGIYRPNMPPGTKGFDQYKNLYADPKLWLRKGWMDYISPQLYWPINSINQSFIALFKWWKDNNPKNIPVWPGIFTSNVISTPQKYTNSEIPSQINIIRKLTKKESIPGHIHFSMKAIQSYPPLRTLLKKTYETEPTLLIP